jgi:hypothetical protein
VGGVAVASAILNAWGGSLVMKARKKYNVGEPGRRPRASRRDRKRMPAGRRER